MTQQGRVVRLGIHLDHLDDPGAAVGAARHMVGLSTATGVK